MATEAEVLAGKRVKAFMDDPAVQAAFARVEERTYRILVSAPTPNDPAAAEAWARGRVLDLLRAELRGVVDAGSRASATQSLQRSLDLPR